MTLLEDVKAAVERTDRLAPSVSRTIGEAAAIPADRNIPVS
jgi:hypothetical protein